MALDLIFAGVLLAMVALGAWRGAVASGAGLGCLIAGYAGAVLGATRWADWVARTLVVSPLVAPAIAGTLGFVAAFLVASGVAEIVVAWDRSRVEAGGRGGLDRALGGFFGLARGGLIVVLLSLLVSWLDAGRDLGALRGLGILPDAERSALVGASGDLVEAAVSSALSDAGPAGEVAARVTARPGRALASMQTILADERFDAMLEDKLFWTAIQSESVEYAMNRRSVRAIVLDAELRARFADLGLVDEAARDDPQVFETALASVLAEMAPRLERLQHDPEMKDLASDPEIIALVESGDTLALLGHPRIRRLVERISGDL